MKLYHVTSTKNIESIKNDGFLKPKTYWIYDNDALVEYYMETISDEGETPIILTLETQNDDSFAPDKPGIEEPITCALDLSEKEIKEEWKNSDKDWEASLEIINSIVIKNKISIDRLKIYDMDLNTERPFESKTIKLDFIP